MKNRMNVPQEYEPVLPGKVKAHIEKEEGTGNPRFASHTNCSRRRKSHRAAET